MLIWNIGNPDMVRKPGELQSVYNELRFYVELASPCKSFEILLITILVVRLRSSARQRYWTIGSLYHKFIVLTSHRAQVSINTNKKMNKDVGWVSRPYLDWLCLKYAPSKKCILGSPYIEPIQQSGLSNSNAFQRKAFESKILYIYDHNE